MNPCSTEEWSWGIRWWTNCIW